jgi:hypothetical protein
VDLDLVPADPGGACGQPMYSPIHRNLPRRVIASGGGTSELAPRRVLVELPVGAGAGTEPVSIDDKADESSLCEHR